MSPPGAPSSELVPRLGVSPPVSCALPLPQLKRRVCHECVSTRAASAYDAGGAHDAAGPATGWRRTYGRLSLQRAAPRMARRGDPPHLHVYPARSLRVFHMPAQQCVFPASWYDSLFLQPLSDGWLHHKGWPSCFLYPQGSASDRGRTSCRRGKYVPFADSSSSPSSRPPPVFFVIRSGLACLFACPGSHQHSKGSQGKPRHGLAHQASTSEWSLQTAL